jgi:sugar lactone lactonase YvrE
LRLNTGSGDNDQHFVNAHGTGSSSSPTFPSNYSTITSLVTDAAGITTTFVKKPPTSTFDDLVVYNSPQFNMNKLPAYYAANVSTPTVSGPANQLWVSGQYLTFTLTFSSPVTVVSGTPRLDLTVNGYYGSLNGGTTAYATYYGGSGGDTLTFRYLIGTTDYTSMGITLAPSIDLNGAVINPCQSSFSSPNLSGVLINSALYIADWGNNRLRSVMLATGIITTVAGKSSSGSSGDGGLASSAKLYQPEGVAADSSSNIYIADCGNNKVRMISASTGYISTFAGKGTAGYSGDGGAATSAKLSGPCYLTFDASNNLYISDYGNNAIRMVTSAGIITTVAGDGTGNAGSSGDGGLATSAELNQPSDTYVDSSGNLYIADTTNNKIREVVASTGKIYTIAGTGSSGSSGNGGLATSAKLNGPTGVTMDSAGNIYISDYYNNVVRKITVSTGIISLYAGTGSTGYSGDGGAATSAKINEAGFGIMDGSNNFYFSDVDNARIRVVSASTGIITTIAGNGSESYGGDGGQATNASVDYAGGIAIVNR